MHKLLAVYVVAIPIFCGLAFQGLSAVIPQGSPIVTSEAHPLDRDISSQVAECVLSTLREQEEATEADREDYIRAMRGVPVRVYLEMMRIRPPPPTAAEVEYARNQQLIRIKELCRLRVSAVD